MISAINDPFEIDAQYQWEEDDKLIAATLSFETEQRLLELAREIRTVIMSSPLGLPAEEAAQAASEQLFLRGKYELLLQLVQDSKEAKAKQHLI